MARSQAFLMSLLARQLTLANETFLKRYPHCWLVWEPGEWAVPSSGVDVGVAETRLPGGKAPERPLGDDALCFALEADEDEALRLGRATENELVVPDMTVSRLHARLELRGGTWKLVPTSQDKKTSVGGAEVATGSAIALGSGQVLELGGVKVTFYDAPGFKARVALAGRFGPD